MAQHTITLGKSTGVQATFGPEGLSAKFGKLFKKEIQTGDELFDVHVDGNTNPKRLFLDPEIDEGILNEVIPLTIMMNGACTKDMWERIMEVNAEPGEEVEKGVHE